MSDSNTRKVYIDSDETITDVRERLARLPQRNLALVVPQRTQLQNPVAWKLLARCAQELGKELVIVSTDRQIRALAKSVKFALLPAALTTRKSSSTTSRAAQI